MRNYETITGEYLENLRRRRAENASKDTIRQDFLNYLQQAFPNLTSQEIDLERTVELQNHGSGAD